MEGQAWQGFQGQAAMLAQVGYCLHVKSTAVNLESGCVSRKQSVSHCEIVRQMWSHVYGYIVATRKQTACKYRLQMLMNEHKRQSGLQESNVTSPNCADVVACADVALVPGQGVDLTTIKPPCLPGTCLSIILFTFLPFPLKTVFCADECLPRQSMPSEAAAPPPPIALPPIVPATPTGPRPPLPSSGLCCGWAGMCVCMSMSVCVHVCVIR